MIKNEIKPACRQAGIKNSVFGFTLIELLVSVSILMIVLVSGTIYLNKLGSQQKLNKAQNEIISMVNLVQNYAKIKQKPNEYVDEVRYIRLQKLPSGKIEADVNGVGETYFSRDIIENGLTVSFDPMYFWGGSGKQVKLDGTFFSPGETSLITLNVNQNVNMSEIITVNALGGVE